MFIPLHFAFPLPCHRRSQSQKAKGRGQEQAAEAGWGSRGADPKQDEQGGLDRLSLALFVS